MSISQVINDVQATVVLLNGKRLLQGGTDCIEQDNPVDAAVRHQGDIATRTVAVSALGLTLTSGLAPVELARGLGLHVLSRLPPLKRALIREGLAPANIDPTLMRRQRA